MEMHNTNFKIYAITMLSNELLYNYYVNLIISRRKKVEFSQ